VLEVYSLPQFFKHILSNALKFTKKYKIITCGGEKNALGFFHIQNFLEKKYLHVSNFDHILIEF